MSAATIATLSAVHAVLTARGHAATFERTGGGRVFLGGVCVAFQRDDEVVVAAVRDGLDPALDVLPEAAYRPTASRSGIAVIAGEVLVRLPARAAEAARGEAQRAERVAAHPCGDGCRLGGCPSRARDPEPAYQPYHDAWPRYEGPAREDDHAAGMLHTYCRADELTPDELADLPPAVRAEVDADLAAMDAEAGIGADDERGWRDHEHGGEPMAAE